MRDQQGETITAAAMKAAARYASELPARSRPVPPGAWSRPMSMTITQICAHVVDPLAITKVRAGVYAGFSIGGKVLKRDTADRSVITALKLVEISLVDSPCTPDAVINMWKTDMDYVPSSDEVVSKARELADDAGSRRYKDFLFKARERLIAAALASDRAMMKTTRRGSRRMRARLPTATTTTMLPRGPDGGKPNDVGRSLPNGDKPAASAAPARPKPASSPPPSRNRSLLKSADPKPTPTPTRRAKPIHGPMPTTHRRQPSRHRIARIV